MWDLYAAKGAGVAVQTSYRALKDCIPEAQLVDPVFFTKMRYIDFETGAFEGPRVDSDGFSAFMYKRKSFEHEREVRIVTTNRFYGPSHDHLEIVPGIRLSVDLNRLLQRILIAPTASALFSSAVIAVMRRFGWADRSVERSDIARSPIY